jgi:hypothetical protein
MPNTSRRIVKLVATLAFDDPEVEEMAEARTDLEEAKQALIENACDDCVIWTVFWSDGDEETR